jgi:tRNA threonylcarbamoyladenosine biosynthesis protein TsaB
MKILAIDSSGITAGAAIISGGEVLAERSSGTVKKHSETLMPMVAEVFQTVNLAPADIDYIACVSGPGSFTGLRIGASTAKGIAFAADIKIIPVPSLDVMTFNVYREYYEGTVIVPMTDARGGRSYTAFFKVINDGFERISPYMCESNDWIKREAASFGKSVVFTGYEAEKPNTCAAPSAGLLAARRVSEAAACADFKLLYVMNPSAKRIDER